MARFRDCHPHRCRCQEPDDLSPSAIIIPLCPCSPRHVLNRAANPAIQKQLSEAVRNILDPHWVTSSYPSSEGSTPPRLFRRISSASSDMETFDSPTLDLTDVRVVPRTPPSGRSLPLPRMMSRTSWSHANPTATDDSNPPQLIPAPGAPMPLRHNPPSSSSSLTSWEANTMQAACALTDLARTTQTNLTDRQCTTILEIASDEHTERAPNGLMHMDTTSDSSFQRSNTRIPKNAPSRNNSLSSLDEAATLVRPQLPSPALSHDDVIRSLDALQYTNTEDPIQAWLAATPSNTDTNTTPFPIL